MNTSSGLNVSDGIATGIDGFATGSAGIEYKCRFCSEKFAAAKEWSEHQQEHMNDPSERKYCCSFCPKKFKDCGQ